MSISFVGLGALCVAAIFSAISSAGERDRQTITIRASQPLPASVQQLLGNLAEDVHTDVGPGVNPFSKLRSQCGGSFTNDYYEQAKTRNPNFVFATNAQSRSLALPACPKVNKNVAVTVLPGDNAASILRRTLGVLPDDIISVCDSSSTENRGVRKIFSKCKIKAIDAVATLNGGKTARIDALQVGRVITVPTYTQPTTIALRDGVQAPQAIAQLQIALQTARVAAPEKAIVAIAQSANLQLIHPLQADAPALTNTSCSPSLGAPSNWPFDRTRVQRAIDNSRLAAANKGIPTMQTVIRIADTGVLGLNGYFPQNALAVNIFDKPHQNVDWDKNGFVGDRYGIDADGAGEIEPYEDDPYKLHGTQIADAALGSHSFRSGYPRIFDLLQLNFAKIFWKGAGSISVNDSVFISAIRAIKNHTMPSVINFSVGAESENSTRLFVQNVQNAPQLNFLAVLAAGNSSKDIGENPTFPAAYAGTGSDVSSWIITVGAHDPSGHPTDFTNFSRDRVDLLAPGCRIPFTGLDGKTELLNGTSIAAPQVAFTAGVIHALGVASMIDVKTRIIASADFDPTVQTRYGGSILNVERAVTLYEDSVRLRNENADADIHGTWQRPEGELPACKQHTAFNPQRILSIAAYDVGGVRWLRIIRLDADGRMAEPTFCEAGTGGITFRDSTGAKRDIDWTQLTALVPAFPFLNWQQ